MCLVTEHVKLKKNYKALEIANAGLRQQVAELQPKQYVPVTDLLTITRAEYVDKLAAFGITPISRTDPLDDVITLASMAELERLAPDICYPADWYAETIWDCENYSAQAANDAARLFHVNGICRCLGQSPLGYHAFVATIDKDTGELWLLEPNSGFDFSGGWVRAEEIDYKPMKVEI